MDHLKSLTQLRQVDLLITHVANEGVKKLQQALPNCKIGWEPPTPPAR